MFMHEIQNYHEAAPQQAPASIIDRKTDVGQHATAKFPQSGSGLSSQLVVVIAAIVIATPVSAATGAASHTCVRHGRQGSTNSGLRRTDAQHHSVLSGTEQHHKASQYYQPQQFAHWCPPIFLD
jgi:hypothetical protein